MSEIEHLARGQHHVTTSLPNNGCVNGHTTRCSSHISMVFQFSSPAGVWLTANKAEICAAVSAHEALEGVLFMYWFVTCCLCLLCVYYNSSIEHDKRRRSSEKTSPLEGIKRSERLRDRRVHYVDMIQGIHPRHSSVDGADGEPKPNPQPVPKSDLLHGDSSIRIGVPRPSSTERPAKSEAAAVDTQQSTVSVACRRRSMELRSSTDGVLVKPEPLSLSMGASGGRRGHTRYRDAPHGTVTSSVSTVSVEPSISPSAAPTRRHRGNSRYRRRMAARRRSKLLSAPAVLNSSSGLVECSQQSIAAAGSCLIDEQSLVKSAGTADHRMAKIDSGVVDTSVGCDSADVEPMRTPINDADMDASCDSVGDTTMPLTNLVFVMHLDLSNRVGRRRRSQDGIVLLDRYTSADAACVRCCNCLQMMSVGEFVGHVHHTHRAGLGSVRRLGPRGVAGPEWHEFQRRRVQFANRARTDPHLPDQVIPAAILETPASESISHDPTVDTADGSVPSVLVMDEVGDSGSAQDQTPMQAVVEDRRLDTPVAGEVTTDTDAEENSAQLPAVTEVIASSVGNESSSVGVSGSSSRPLESAVVAVSCHVAVRETSAAPEPRVTRSRSTNISPVEPPATLPSLRNKSATLDTPRHSERTCTRARGDSTAAATSTPTGSGSSNADSPHPQLRPRPPPRATAPK